MNNRLFNRLIAAFLAGTLIFMAPGLPCYQALAAEADVAPNSILATGDFNQFGKVSPAGDAAINNINVRDNSNFAIDLKVAPADADVSAQPDVATAVSAENGGSFEASQTRNVAAEVAGTEVLRRNFSHDNVASARTVPTFIGKGPLGWLRQAAASVGEFLNSGTSVSQLRNGAAQEFERIDLSPLPQSGKEQAGAVIQNGSRALSLRERGRVRVKASLVGVAAALPVLLTASVAVAKVVPSQAQIPAVAAVHAWTMAQLGHFFHVFLPAAYTVLAHSSAVKTMASFLHPFFILQPGMHHALLFGNSNIIAAFFGMPLFFLIFLQGGSDETKKNIPLDEVAIGAISSLLVGLIVAPLKGNLGWALQNNLGGASFFIAPFLYLTLRLIGAQKSSKAGALAKTVLAVAILGTLDHFLTQFMGTFVPALALTSLIRLLLLIPAGANFLLRCVYYFFPKDAPATDKEHGRELWWLAVSAMGLAFAFLAPPYLTSVLASPSAVYNAAINMASILFIGVFVPDLVRRIRAFRAGQDPSKQMYWVAPLINFVSSLGFMRFWFGNWGYPGWWQSMAQNVLSVLSIFINFALRGVSWWRLRRAAKSGGGGGV